MDLETYENAVTTLIGLAQDCTGSARVAAQVLLSAFDGGSYQLAVSELGILDDDYYDAAIAVIRGRRELHYEPHHLVENGSDIFTELQGRWWRLHVKRRGKRSCPDCSGTGHSVKDLNAWNKGIDKSLRECSRCEGEGLIEG